MRGSDLPGLEVSATWMICQCKCVASSACALKKAPTSAPVLLMGVKLRRTSLRPWAAQIEWLGELIRRADRDFAEMEASSPLAISCGPNGPQSLCCDASSMSHAETKEL
jgi:hypothetical protein